MHHPQPLKNHGLFLFGIFILFISFHLAIPVYAAIDPADDAFLEEVQRKTFDYFIAERNPETGLVRDRANNFKKGATLSPASIAATGFALTVYGVGVKRGWLDEASAKLMTTKTLRFFLTQAPQEHGFYYHFMDPATGKRASRSEISPIDTALFLAGALFAAEFYQDTQIHDLAYQIYNRVDWPWLLHGGKTLSLSWSPESGFNKHRWDHFDESLLMYILAIGSTAHPLAPETWKEILRPVGSYGGHRLIQMPPLFTHQYPHAWIDFRNKHDGFADYFKNSTEATLANRAFALDNAGRFAGYSENSWGITASDSPAGYQAYGAPPGWAKHDGTVAPTACGNSIVFTPTESIACMKFLRETYGDKIWGNYGFSSSFNLGKKWYATDAIGIDQGALILLIENFRSELIWQTMNRVPEIQNAMKAVGFQPGTRELPWPDPPEYRVPYVSKIRIDGYLKDWPNAPAMRLDSSFRESGTINDAKDLSAEIRFAWDEKGLYFFTKVADDQILLLRNGKNIWQDDLLEIYVNPDGQGLDWGNRKDYQIGFRPNLDQNAALVWSWFQGGANLSETGKTVAAGFVDPDGYLLEGRISWEDLKMHPKAGDVVRLSPAVHDIDKDRSSGKLHWFFRNEDKPLRFMLGKLILQPEAKLAAAAPKEETVS